jgi:Fur family ferric uptake transcriptional regulator
MTTIPNENQLSGLLEKHHLKKTRTRLKVLGILNSREVAISQPRLEDIIGTETDRVTLYRTLKVFEEKGIIHKIIDMNGTANYALCNSACTEHEHHDEHVHFNCTVCFHIYCLDNFHIPKVGIPPGFSAGSVNLIIYGICDSCNKKE